MKTIVNLLVLFLLAPQFINATQYYVSASAPNDNNDGTTIAKAWKTLTHADVMVSAGDVINVMNGTYNPFTVYKSGSLSGGYITYKAYPGHNPKVSCGPSGAWDLVRIAASYIVWDGIEVVGINQSTNLADAEANYNNIEELLNIYKMKDIPQSEWNKTTSTVLNGITIGTGDGDGDKAKIFPVVTNITVKNCIVHDCAGAGISGTYSDNVVIENNIVYNNCWFSMWAPSGISFMYQSGYGTTIIRGNTVYNNYCLVKWAGKYILSDGNGIIIDVNADYYNGYFTIENNLVYDNGGRGLYVMDAKNATFRNNTSYWNSKSWFSTGGEMVCFNSSNVAYINNIAWANPSYFADNYALNDFGNWGTNSNITWQNNITYNGTPAQSSVNLSQTSTTYIDNSNKLGVNPSLVDPKISNGNNFQANTGSPVINSGTSGYGVSYYDLAYNDRVQGGTVDIGCYEKTPAQQLAKTTSSIKALNVAQLGIYPNPVSSGIVTLKLSGFNQEKVQLSIFDAQGRLLLSKSLLNQSKIEIATLNILKQGIYFVKAQSTNLTIVEKLLYK